MQRADELDFDYVVTGHYSVIEYDEGLQRYLLRKSPDVTKDQSYVLYSLTQRQLSRTLLPLGKLTKHEVRKIAEKYNLINAQNTTVRIFVLYLTEITQSSLSSTRAESMILVTLLMKTAMFSVHIRAL